MSADPHAQYVMAIKTLAQWFRQESKKRSFPTTLLAKGRCSNGDLTIKKATHFPHPSSPGMIRCYGLAITFCTEDILVPGTAERDMEDMEDMK